MRCRHKHHGACNARASTHQRVSRAPWVRFVAKNDEFKREVRVRVQVCVDTICVGLHRCLRLGLQLRPCLLCSGIKPVHRHFLVRRQSRSAGDFCEACVADAPLKLHLPHAILRVDNALETRAA